LILCKSIFFEVPIKNGDKRLAAVFKFNVLNPGMAEEDILPGIELFSRGAATQLSSPLLRFTTEFEMDRCGTTAPWTPG
jgi:hypothetical protein